MTITEALGAVCAEQGFLVLNSSRTYRIGEIVGDNASLYARRGDKTLHEDISQPVQVVALATREDFLRQVRRLDFLLNTNSESWEIAHPNLYRVVTD